MEVPTGIPTGVPIRRHALVHCVPGPVGIVELCTGKYDLRRGDIIFDTDDCNYGYRSAGMYFFDGVRILPPCSEYDDYGLVPTEFPLIVEFPPGYWDLPLPGDTSDIRHYEFVVNDQPGLKVFTPAPSEPIGCWHDPDNQGASRLYIAAASSGTVQNHSNGDARISSDGQVFWHASIEITDCEDTIIIITYNGTKYALITPKTFEDVEDKIRACSAWWVKSYYNTANWIDGEYFRTELSDYLESLGVEPKNMMCEID